LALRASTPEGLEKILRKFIVDKSTGQKQVIRANRIVRKMEDPIARLISLLTKNA
jgi:hypothetical protein